MFDNDRLHVSTSTLLGETGNPAEPQSRYLVAGQERSKPKSIICANHALKIPLTQDISKTESYVNERVNLTWLHVLLLKQRCVILSTKIEELSNK